jgi:hypothetical protein
MPSQFVKAFMYAVLLWVIGFVWGSIVFMTPALKVSPIPYVSSNPAISFPILLMWLIVSYLLAKNYLNGATDKVAEGLRLGLTFSAMNAILDLVVSPFAQGRVRLFCFADRLVGLHDVAYDPLAHGTFFRGE